jgi:O-methyltransferase/aklanonic acid methyltransferase
VTSGDAEVRKAQTVATFNRLAPVYDAAGVACFAHFGRRLVEAAALAPGQSLLDVATGRGAVLIPAAERVAPDGRVVGVDLAAAMLEAARRDIAAHGLTAELRVMDAEHLEFAEASFDAVLCGFGLMFFPDLSSALTQMRIVLRPGGTVGASTWHTSQADDVATVLDELALGGPPAPGWITEPRALAQLLRDAGFQNVEAWVERTTFRYDDLEQYWQNAMGTGERRRLEALSADETARVRQRLAERVQPHLRADGLHLAAAAVLVVARR